MTISPWPIAVHVEILAPSFLCTQSGSKTERITSALTVPSVSQAKQTLLPELLPVDHAPNPDVSLLDFLQIVTKFSWQIFMPFSQIFSKYSWPKTLPNTPYAALGLLNEWE